MACAMVRFVAKGWVRQLYLAPAFHFPYPGFEWVRPWPDALMYAHFILLALLALGIALGVFYRVCATLFFVGFTYIELLDQTAYLNHYYLISLLAGLLIVLPANRAWSIDAWRKSRIRTDVVPAWCLNILRFQIGVVYVFAGLAKFNADWLFRAQPLRIWLAARSDLPLVGHWLEQAWVAYAASWLGAVFDTGIVFFLLHKRTRRPAYILLILFHVATWLLFNIGMFPWIMILGATVFFPPDWPRYWLSRLTTWTDSISSSRFNLRISNRSRPRPRPRFSAFQDSEFKVQGSIVQSSRFRNRLLLPFLSLYAAIQLALPLRSYFFSQPCAWTCSGFNCAWRVMIAEKTGYAEFYAFDPATGRRRKLSLNDYITPRQEMMMAQNPYLIRDMARHLAEDFKRREGRDLQIAVESFATLNGRSSQPLISPEVDLARSLGPGWIVCLKR